MKLNLSINVKTYNNVGPNIKIWLNGNVYYEDCNVQESKTYKVPLEKLQDINFLFVEHHGKTPLHLPPGEDIAIEIEQIMFDQVKLHDNLLSDQYLFPNWQYGDTPSFVYKNCYIGYNGIWQFAFPKDPITWIMDYVESENFQQSTQSAGSSESSLDDFINMFD